MLQYIKDKVKNLSYRGTLTYLNVFSLGVNFSNLLHRYRREEEFSWDSYSLPMLGMMVNLFSTYIINRGQSFADTSELQDLAARLETFAQNHNATIKHLHEGLGIDESDVKTQEGQQNVFQQLHVMHQQR